MDAWLATAKPRARPAGEALPDRGPDRVKHPRATKPRLIKGPTASEARAAVIPFARLVPCHNGARLALRLEPSCALVNGYTFRAMVWGGSGHRDGLLANAPSLVAHVRSLLAAVPRSPDGPVELPWIELPDETVAAHLDEWSTLPFAVEQLEPREGHVFVSAGWQKQIDPRGSLYNRIFVEEGVPPKQMPREQYEAEQAAAKAHELATRDETKAFGECAPLGVRLRVVRTPSDGDCFFQAIVKAFGGKAAGGLGEATAVRRDLAMWRQAHGEATPLPPESELLSVAELRRVVAACYSEQVWLIAHSLSLGSCSQAQFQYVDDSLEGTRERIRTPAAELKKKDLAHLAYWADENAVATVQRYLHCRILIFNPQAAVEHRCQTSGDLHERADRRVVWVVLRHTHAKAQHYELFAHGERSVFEREELPEGIVAAFSRRVSF